MVKIKWRRAFSPKIRNRGHEILNLVKYLFFGNNVEFCNTSSACHAFLPHLQNYVQITHCFLFFLFSIFAETVIVLAETDIVLDETVLVLVTI